MTILFFRLLKNFIIFSKYFKTINYSTIFKSCINIILILVLFIKLIKFNLITIYSFVASLLNRIKGLLGLFIYSVILFTT